MTNSRALVLGIDTGGTFTDGVLLEYYSREVLSTYKSLTTHRDYSLGIERVIENIQLKDPAAIQMVSISTTLATNAIAEGKGKRVVLFLIGYDPELISAFKMENRFATPHFHFFAGGHDLFGDETEPLDLKGILAKAREVKDEVDAIAVSGYFSPLNPSHELRIFEALSQTCDLPIVLGHHLSRRLDSVTRATTAAINASLLAVLQDFISTVRRVMGRRGIDAPLMVMRGDGTLMSETYATRSPIEMIHSGPAASAIGGRFLSKHKDALVVDVGGTTTDFALIDEGAVKLSEEGAVVSGFKTSVRAANLLSIGLGGDSQIRLGQDNNIAIGPNRVVPLAQLSAEHPDVRAYIKSLTLPTHDLPHPDRLEHWFLLREPKNLDILKDHRQKMLLEMLRDGPKPTHALLNNLDLFHVSQFGAEELFRHEIVGRAGFTPTDLLHLDGRYASWDSTASAAALQVFSRYLRWERGDLTQFIWSQIAEKIVRAIVSFMKDEQLEPRVPLGGSDAWFIQNSVHGSHLHLETIIRLLVPIIGIGAPAKIFLKKVAGILRTRLDLPEHYPVANAIGAVAGSVMAVEEVVIYPKLSESGLDVLGYILQGGETRGEFEALNEAIDHARIKSCELSKAAAMLAGAENPKVVLEEIEEGMDMFRIRAKAFGSPRFKG